MAAPAHYLAGQAQRLSNIYTDEQINILSVRVERIENYLVQVWANNHRGPVINVASSDKT